MDHIVGDDQHTTVQPTRRTVAKGLAWAVPVITAGASVPAMALSGPPPTLTYIGACKSPGNSCKDFKKGYDLRFNVTNNSGVTVYFYSVAFNQASQLSFNQALPPLPVAVPPGGTTLVVFRANGQNSGNQTFTATLTIGWGHTSNEGGDPYDHPPIVQSVTIPGTPPCCECSATPTTSNGSCDPTPTTSASSAARTSQSTSTSQAAPSNTAPAAPASTAPASSSPAAPAVTSSAAAPTSTSLPPSP